MAADGIYKLTVNGFWGPRADRFQMGFDYNVQGTSGSVNRYTVAKELVAKFIAGTRLSTLAACLDESIMIDSIKAVGTKPNGGIPAVTAVTQQGSWGDAGVSTIAMGAQVRWVLAAPDEGAGVVHQGWTTLPGIPDDAYEDAEFTAGYVAALVAWATTMIPTITLAGPAAGTAEFVREIKGLTGPLPVIQGEIKERPGSVRNRLDRKT